MTRLVSVLLVAAGVFAITAPEGPKTIIDLQPFRRVSSGRVRDRGRGVALLVNLNPAINTWYTLSVPWSDSVWHLENPKPREAPDFSGRESIRRGS